MLHNARGYRCSVLSHPDAPSSTGVSISVAYVLPTTKASFYYVRDAPRPSTPQPRTSSTRGPLPKLPQLIGPRESQQIEDECSSVPKPERAASVAQQEQACQETPDARKHTGSACDDCTICSCATRTRPVRPACDRQSTTQTPALILPFGLPKLPLAHSNATTHPETTHPATTA